MADLGGSGDVCKCVQSVEAHDVSLFTIQGPIKTGELLSVLATLGLGFYISIIYAKTANKRSRLQQMLLDKSEGLIDLLSVVQNLNKIKRYELGVVTSVLKEYTMESYALTNLLKMSGVGKKAGPYCVVGANYYKLRRLLTYTEADGADKNIVIKDGLIEISHERNSEISLLINSMKDDVYRFKCEVIKG